MIKPGSATKHLPVLLESLIILRLILTLQMYEKKAIVFVWEKSALLS
jgi:hypothetical protein